MKKVVINRCYGGFGLSEKAVLRYFELIGKPIFVVRDRGFVVNHYYFCEPSEYNKLYEEAKKTGDYSKVNGLSFHDRYLERDDPILAQVVEELGEEANGNYAELGVVEIPDDVEYIIEDYDGVESIHERHEVWY
jgi:hypothetical protein